MKHHGLACALVAAAVAFAFAPVLTGRELVPSDLLYRFVEPYRSAGKRPSPMNYMMADAVMGYYPSTLFLKDSLQSGRWPLWNPYLYGGYPQLADTGTGCTDVLTNASYLALPHRIAFNLIPLLQFVIAGTNLYFASRWFGIGWFASALGAIGYSLNTHFMTDLIAGQVIRVCTWLPLGIYASAELARRVSAGLICLLALALGLSLLGGSLQTSAFAVIAVGLVWLVGMLDSPRPVKVLLPRLAAFAGAGALAAAVAGAALLPALELWSLKARNPGASGHWHGWSQPLVLLGAVFFPIPTLNGSARTFDLTRLVGANLDDWQASIGFLPLWFAVSAACVAPWRKVRPFAALCGASLVVVGFTPLVGIFYTRFLCLFVLGAAFLAALGAEHVFGKDGDQLRHALSRLIRAGFVFLAVVAGAILVAAVFVISARQALVGQVTAAVLRRGARAYFGFDGDWLRERALACLDYVTPANPELLLPIALAATGLLVLDRYLRGRLAATPAKGVILLLAAADLTVFVRSYVPMVDTRRYPVLTDLAPLEWIKSQRGWQRYRTMIISGGSGEPVVMPTALPMVYGLPTINGRSALYPRTVLHLNPALVGKAVGGAKPGEIAAVDGRLDRRLLSLQSVRWIMSHRSSAAATEGLILGYDREVRVWENPEALPRAFLARGFVVHADEVAARKWFESAEFDPEVVALEPAAATDAPPRLGRGAVEADVYEPERVRVDLTLGEPGMLVLGDTYYPGWQVEVDGRPGRLLRANLYMRATWVPAGRHTVEFRYRPASFRLGLALSITGLAACGTLALMATLHRARAVRSAEPGCLSDRTARECGTGR